MKRLICFCVAGILFAGCGASRKVKALRAERIRAEVSVAGGSFPKSGTVLPAGGSPGPEVPETERPGTGKRYSAAEEDAGGERIVMNAVRDDETGEMVPTEQLQEVVITAPFRNVAERHGQVEIAFDIVVPARLRDPRWQVRFRPCFFLAGDTLFLNEVYITGTEYRKGQLRGYELYRRFLHSIVPDSCDFTYRRLLDIFIDRNFPHLGTLRNDTTLIDTLSAGGLFGVSGREAVEYYTKQWLVRRNDRRKQKKDRMYGRYIKAPLAGEGVRLDTVIASADGSVAYRYFQTIGTRKGLRRVEMVLSGGIYEADRCLYTMPETDPLVFYISSVSSFADTSVRYIDRVVERNAEANTAAYIEFPVGEYTLNDTLSENEFETGRIKGNIRQLMTDRTFLIDSLVITAACSPEGAFKENRALAGRRAAAIRDYFSCFMSDFRDSLRNRIWHVDLSGDGAEEEMYSGRMGEDLTDVIRTRSVPEEWDRLERLVRNDTVLADKKTLLGCFEISDPDLREAALSRTKEYRYLRSVLYPKLRIVRFDFFLHRKGMIKDTVHTTEIDTAYMAGIRALLDRDYPKAAGCLRPYEDMNTAVAYLCADFNVSALEVLEKLPESGRRNYMLAMAYARLGEEKRAVEFIVRSIGQDPAMRHRARLDPEISALVKKYGMEESLGY